MSRSPKTNYISHYQKDKTNYISVLQKKTNYKTNYILITFLITSKIFEISIILITFLITGLSNYKSRWKAYM